MAQIDLRGMSRDERVDIVPNISQSVDQLSQLSLVSEPSSFGYLDGPVRSLRRLDQNLLGHDDRDLVQCDLRLIE